MIHENEGRARSERTTQELLDQLKREMEGLSPAERETLEVLLKELEHPASNAEAPTLLKTISSLEYKHTPVDMRTFVMDDYYLGKTCDNIYPRILDDLAELFEGGYSECVFTGCIELDAIIQGANGSLRTIREWIGSEGAVVGFTPRGAASAPTGVAKHSGTRPAVRLELANGMAQRLTPDHMVVAWRGGGLEWTSVGKLTSGDLVVVPRRLRTRPDSSLTADEARLLAYWCADGSSSEQRSRFCDGNPATSLEVLTLLESQGFSGKREPKGENCWEVYVEEHKRSGFLAWLREHQGHLPTAEVLVPDAVCRSSDEVVAAFLNRLWACEGCVYVNPRKSPPRFTLGMTSERFMRQVQLLLLRFGIQGRLQFTPQYDKRSGKTTETWILSVSGIGSLRRMLLEIGDILGKEEACRQMRAYCSSHQENTNVDVLPLRRKWLSEEMTRRGLTRAASSRWWGLARGSGVYISRRLFDEWLEEFGQTALGRELASRFPPDLAFEEVTEIEGAGEVEVGDICDVQQIQSFVSNGIFSHNSIGWGKTFAASIGICRILYEISCLKNPHETFGLATDSNISIVNLSVSEVLAIKVVFENIATKIKASKYFQEHFKFEVTKKELRFPGNVWVAARASTDGGVLGLNTIAAFMDETNFLPQPKGRSHEHAHLGYYDRAATLYNSIKRRMQSRFRSKGKLPGMLFLVSSKRTVDDFTARRVREAKDNGEGKTDATVFVRDYALWDVKPEDYYSTDKFWVVCGNENTPSRILSKEEEAKIAQIKATLPEGVVAIEVPEDFRGDFERDLEGAIRDIAGVATVAVSPFIQRREKILEAVDPKRSHPFSFLVYDPSKGGRFLYERMTVMTTEVQYDAPVTIPRPILNPRAARHLHIDPSLRGDCTGFCMSHISGWKQVKRRAEDGREYEERAPVYVVDVILRIVPPLGDELVLGDIRRLIYDLSQHGYMITSVSQDQFQSADSIQQLQQKGFNASLVSVDRTIEPYDNLKLALYEGRVNYYHYQPLIDELQKLEKDPIRGKVDHPPGGSKDCSDALAGCLWTLSQNQNAHPTPILKGETFRDDAWLPEQIAFVPPEQQGTTYVQDFSRLPPFFMGGGGSGSGGHGGNDDGWS